MADWLPTVDLEALISEQIAWIGVATVYDAGIAPHRINFFASPAIPSLMATEPSSSAS